MFRSANHYGDRLNSFDLLKLLALSTMIIDHVGYYIFTDIQVLRAVGRMAFPLFLFLVGYSGNWGKKQDLVIWAVLCTGCGVLTNHPVLPFDVLVTILVVRWAMEKIVTPEKLTPRRLEYIFLGSILLYPFFVWTDYGTVALLFALCGYLQRYRPKTRMTLIFIILSMTVHTLLQQGSFHFRPSICLCMSALLVIDVMLMRDFHIKTFDGSFLPVWFRRALQWSARNTLPLYGLHVMLLMIIERFLYPGRFPHFPGII